MISLDCKCEGLPSCRAQFVLSAETRRRLEERLVSAVHEDVMDWLS